MRTRWIAASIALVLFSIAYSAPTRTAALPDAVPGELRAAANAQTATPPDLDYLMYLPCISRLTAQVATPTATVSPTSTSTPTSSPTPSPTPTVTATPTSTSVPVEVLPNHSSYVDSIDNLWIVGEVQNNTDDYLRFVRITTNLFDTAGQLLDISSSYIDLDSLSPDEKTCFSVLFSEEPAGWAYYEFEARYRTGGEPLPNLVIFNDSGSYDPTFGWYEIIGQVRNDHGSRVEFVKPVGTLYDGAGTVVGCDFAYVNARDLEPGQTGSFEMLFTGRDYSDVDAYRLQVDGRLE